MKRNIKVAGAAIQKDGKIFCGQRPDGKVLGGFWELPGGKLEKGETFKEALIREIDEELGVKIKIGEFVGEVVHQYDYVNIEFRVYMATIISGEIKLFEHQDSKWLKPEELESLNWPPATVGIIKMLKEKLIKK